MKVSGRIKYAVEVLSILAFIVGVQEFLAQHSVEPIANECPGIEVTGPSGTSTPGQLLSFVVTVSPEPSSDLRFQWSTSAGEVNQGQSTKSIGVRYLMEMRGTSLIATVKVSGLPTQCKASASDVAPLIWDPGPELLSEFSIPVGSIHQRNLRKAANEQKNEPNGAIYIIEYFPPESSERSIKRKKNKIKAYMVKILKAYGPAITIVTAEADRPFTRIFRVPAGANNPTP